MSDFKRFVDDFDDLPDWVQWVAQDADGCWWGYEVEPNQSHSGWYENEVGDSVMLGKGKSNPDWSESLSKIRR